MQLVMQQQLPGMVQAETHRQELDAQGCERAGGVPARPAAAQPAGGGALPAGHLAAIPAGPLLLEHCHLLPSAS